MLFSFLLVTTLVGTFFSADCNVIYKADPIESFHMSDVEPMMAEGKKVDFVDSSVTANNKTIQPRSLLPYTPAERRRYVHRHRLEALRDDPDEFEDLLYVRGRKTVSAYGSGRKTVSAYDSGEEDYSDDFDAMQRAARRPFQNIRNFFQRPSSTYLRDSPTQRPNIFKRVQSFFRQPTTTTTTTTPQPQVKQLQKTNADSKYQVLFWPITATDSDGMTSTNLVPHLVVRNPLRQEEILYAVPLVQLAQHEDYNIFHTADGQEINSIKKIKSKSKQQKRKQKNKKRKHRPQQIPQPAVNDDEVIMEHIIQSGTDVDGDVGEVEDETIITTTSPPPVPSFIFVGDTENADTEAEADTDSSSSEDLMRLRSVGQTRIRNLPRRYRRRNQGIRQW